VPLFSLESQDKSWTPKYYSLRVKKTVKSTAHAFKSQAKRALKNVSLQNALARTKDQQKVLDILKGELEFNSQQIRALSLSSLSDSDN